MKKGEQRPSEKERHQGSAVPQAKILQHTRLEEEKEEAQQEAWHEGGGRGVGTGCGTKKEACSSFSVRHAGGGHAGPLPKCQPI